MRMFREVTQHRKRLWLEWTLLRAVPQLFVRRILNESRRRALLSSILFRLPKIYRSLMTSASLSISLLSEIGESMQTLRGRVRSENETERRKKSPLSPYWAFVVRLWVGYRSNGWTEDRAGRACGVKAGRRPRLATGIADVHGTGPDYHRCSEGVTAFIAFSSSR